MAAVAAPPPAAAAVDGRRLLLLRRPLPRGKLTIAAVMKDGSASPNVVQKKEVSVENLDEVGGISLKISNSSNALPPRTYCNLQKNESNLRFDRLRLPSEDCGCRYNRIFGSFIAREAIMEEEYWSAAWLRAESHFEEQSASRHIESYKKKYATQEFHALKNRCSSSNTEKCICIVAVKNDNSKRTVINSVVGSLDLCLRHLLSAETFPMEPRRSQFLSRIYQSNKPRIGYISNVCVAQYARRRGIGRNMMLLAVDAAKLNGVEKVFVHVHKNNIPAQKLYCQIGFKIVELCGPLNSPELLLMSFS